MLGISKLASIVFDWLVLSQLAPSVSLKFAEDFNLKFIHDEFGVRTKKFRKNAGNSRVFANKFFWRFCLRSSREFLTALVRKVFTASEKPEEEKKTKPETKSRQQKKNKESLITERSEWQVLEV